jgi:hypothetical protein
MMTSQHFTAPIIHCKAIAVIKLEIDEPLAIPFPQVAIAASCAIGDGPTPSQLLDHPELQPDDFAFHVVVGLVVTARLDGRAIAAARVLPVNQRPRIKVRRWIRVLSIQRVPDL